MADTSHIHDDDLELYSAGHLEPERMSALKAHLSICQDCQERLYHCVPLEVIQGLVESWCDRRCLRALRAVLRGYPLVSPLGDGWKELRLALENVHAFAREEITAQELRTLNNLIRQLGAN